MFKIASRLMLMALAVVGVAGGQAAPHTTEGATVIAVPQTVKPAPTLMNNDSVLKMHAAGLGDDLILQTISAQPGRYETDPDSLIALKKAGCRMKF